MSALLKNVYKVTVFAMPISAGALINMIASFIAMIFVARLGKVELAAAALAISTYITLLTVCTTVFYAVGILISHRRSQSDALAQTGLILKNGFWLALIIAAPVMWVVWHIDAVLLWFKQDPQLVDLAREYFHFAALATLPLMLNTVLAQFYTGIGRPRFSLIVSASALPFLLIGSYGLVLGNFGLPQLGLAGVIASTCIVQSLITICLLIYMYSSGVIKRYQVFANGIGLDWDLCRALFNLGFPIGVQFGAELAALSVATYFMGFFGVTALAAAQISSQYSLLVIMVSLGLSQAVSMLISEAYGRNSVELAKEYIYASLVILGIIFAIVFFFFIGMPHALIKLYVNVDETVDHNLIALATDLLAIAAIMLLVDSIRNMFSGVLRGLHESRAPMRIGIICLWFVSLPVCYVTAFYFNGGPVGLRVGFLSGFVLASIWLWFRIKTRIEAARHDLGDNVV